MQLSNEISCNYLINSDFDVSKNEALKIAVFNCENCHRSTKNLKNLFLNPDCFRNIIKFFKTNSDVTEGVFRTSIGEFKLTSVQLDFFLNYGRQLNKIPLRDSSLKENTNCAEGKDCAGKQNFFLERILGNKYNDGILITNPIESYQEIHQEIEISTEIIKTKPKCHKCYTQYKNFLKRIQALLDESHIIKKFLELNKKSSSYSEIITLIFGDYNLITKSKTRQINLPKVKEVIASYEVHAYKINIISSSELYHLYEISSVLEDTRLKNIYNEVSQQLRAQFEQSFESETIAKLNYIMKSTKRLASQLLRQQYPQLTEDLVFSLSELVSFELAQLGPLMPFLIDDEIEEIFLDSPQSYIYLDHQQFGRCQTMISLSPTEIEGIITRIRFEAEQRLDETHPFLKTELITDSFHSRISLEIAPLAIDEFQMRIRKMHKKFLTIIDLIRNNTLSTEAAAYLLFNWIHGRCILAIGEPYSGKTTLINSLDILGKQDWRKIYIEDVVESLDQSAFGARQSRYQVASSLEELEDYSNKAYQVKECLHRTPDAIFIGELIHSKAVEAFFFLLKVGLRRCLATAHGESPERMVERFIYDDHVELTLIGNLDIVVQMKRFSLSGQNVRRIARITEIIEDSEANPLTNNSSLLVNPKISYHDVYSRDPTSDRIVCTYNDLSELYHKSNSIKGINSLKGEYVSEEQFIREMKTIQLLITKLLERSSENIAQIIKEFQQLWFDLDRVKNKFK